VGDRGLTRFDSEKSASGAVQIEDATIRIGDDDSLQNGIEDRLKETLLSSDFHKVILHLSGLNQGKALNEFVEKTAFHVALD